MAELVRRSRVTIKTVAADAHVSVAAVSRVLRDAYGVSDALRSRVLASMERLNYRPHAAARGMRGRTYTLGVLLPDLRNPFFADIMAGVNDALADTPYHPLLAVGQSAVSLERALLDAMVDRQMDGLILVGSRLDRTDLAHTTAQVPAVVIGVHAPRAPTLDTVNNDDELGGRLAVEHLHEAGYRKIAFFSLELPPEIEDASVGRREAGYRAAMKELGLGNHIRVVHSEQTAPEVREAATKLLTGRGRPEAIFCWTDHVAFQVMGAAQELGLRVPEDLAIVGYDNTMFCDLPAISLTSIDQSGRTLGMKAARFLIERIEGRKEPEHFVVHPTLVARHSSAPRHTRVAKSRPSAKVMPA